MSDRFSPQDEKKIVADYRSGVGMNRLGRKYGCRSTVIRDILDKHCVPIHRHGKLSDELAAELPSMYDSGMSIRAIAIAVGLEDASVRARLVNAGVVMRGPADWNTIDRDTRIRIKMMRVRGKRSIAYISERTGMSQRRVSNWCKRMGLPHIDRRTGPNHPAWRGGRTISGDGYVMIRLDYDDPLINMTNSGGYVAEHRLVMARRLGRRLTNNETVHHKDGNRQNNMLSNLQLRQGKHGKGQVYVCAKCGSDELQPMELT